MCSADCSQFWEKAQLEAYPNINTTIKDRYFTSACATPGSVFPTLIKLSRHHIRVIKDIKLKCYLDNQIKDLIDKLVLPTRLSPPIFH